MFSSKSFMFLCLDLYFELFLYMVSGTAHNKLRKILKEMGLSDHLTCLLRNLYGGTETTVRQGTKSGSKLGKEYIKAVYYHPAYMQNTSCEMLGWMKPKLE